MTKRPKDFPIETCRQAVDAMLAINPDIEAFQKFSCAGCGQRLTMDVPNAWFTTGTCDKCGHVTDIAKAGCNYLLHIKVRM